MYKMSQNYLTIVLDQLHVRIKSEEQEPDPKYVLAFFLAIQI